MTPSDAIAAFGATRGHPIERGNYIADLKARRPGGGLLRGGGARGGAPGGNSDGIYYAFSRTIWTYVTIILYRSKPWR